MDIIEKSNYYGYPKNKMWYAVEFNIVNPTTSPYTIDLFNGYNQVPVPITPNIPVSPIATSIYDTGFGSIYYTAYCSSNNSLYASENNANKISIFNASTNVLTSNISGAGSPYSLCYNSINNRIYYTDSGGSADTIRIVNCVTNLIIGSITIPSFGDGIIVFNSSENKAYVSSTVSNSVYVIDCSTDTLLTSINVGSTSIGICYNSLNNSIYVPCFSTGEVKVIDCSTDSVSSTITGFSSPSFVSYNSFSDDVYVSNSGTDELIVLDCSTNTVINTISVGVNPYYSGYNPYNNYIYVSNQTSLTISIINCSNNTLVSNISFSVDPPLGLTYNPSKNNMYVGQSSFLYTVDTFVLVPFIEGTTDYNQFVRELQNIPKRVRHIRLTTESYSQMGVPLYLLKRDANGIFCGDPKIPTEYLRPEDYQSFICELPFSPKELILNNNEIISGYTLAPESTVKMTIYFDEIDMSDLLSEKLNVYNQIETKVEDLNTISEQTLETRYETRLSVKPSWLKNFKSGKSIKI